MALSGNALIMREVNTNLVRKTLKAMKQATKQQIAKTTGLSTVTIATIMQQLTEANEVVEIEPIPSAGGRPAHQFQFNKNFAHALTLFTHEQEGQDMLYIRVANLFGECVKAQDIPLDNIRLDSFVPWIDTYLEEFPSIRAIGFGLPGFEFGGKIIVLDYPALVGTQLTNYYFDRYHLPIVFENDVNAAVMGYCKRVQIQPEAVVIYAYFPKKYPPGSGICADGKLFKGVSNAAGEFSNIPFEFDWLDPNLYLSSEHFCPAITKVIVTMSSLLNPSLVILHGDFLTPDSIQTITQSCSEYLPQSSIPNIQLSEDFTADYQTGMIAETLACLEPRISLVQSA